jgi:hypothetical protein
MYIIYVYVNGRPALPGLENTVTTRSVERDVKNVKKIQWRIAAVAVQMYYILPTPSRRLPLTTPSA